MRVRRNLERDSWLIAWVLTLALHALAFVGFRNASFLRSPAPNTIQQPAPVRLVFVRPGPASHASQEPQTFTELPTDRADKAPKRPDFLSNVTSRARDQVAGGDQALPRMQGEVDAPMVKMDPTGGTTPQTPAFSSQLQHTDHATTRPQDSPPQKNPPTQPPNGTAGAMASSALPNDADASRSNDAAHPPPSVTGSSGVRGLAGNSDIRQPDMANPNGNAALTGDISLNTTAWDYAPWLQRFGRQLMRAWIPPPAYSIGILKEGGWATFELEISRSGKLLRLDHLEDQGHPSLGIAAENAIHTMGSIERLPPDFPEPTLILRLRMIYPRIHPR